MRAQSFPAALAIVLGITLGACDGESTKSVETPLGPSPPEPSTAQARGGPLYWLGHSSPAMVQRVYAQLGTVRSAGVANYGLAHCCLRPY
jgi:hypothetical protein